MNLELTDQKYRDMYRGISDFKKGYQPRTNTVRDEKVIWLQTLTDGGNISLSYCMFLVLTMIVRHIRTT
jgi:hypothetical protein